jgi:hypothetical protein
MTSICADGRVLKCLGIFRRQPLIIDIEVLMCGRRLSINAKWLYLDILDGYSQGHHPNRKVNPDQESASKSILFMTTMWSRLMATPPNTPWEKGRGVRVELMLDNPRWISMDCKYNFLVVNSEE